MRRKNAGTKSRISNVRRSRRIWRSSLRATAIVFQHPVITARLHWASPRARTYAAEGSRRTPLGDVEKHIFERRRDDAARENRDALRLETRRDRLDIGRCVAKNSVDCRAKDARLLDLGHLVERAHGADCISGA